MRRILLRAEDTAHRVATLPPPFPPPCPYKVAYAEVAEQRQHDHRAHQAAMPSRVRRTRMPLPAQLPQIPNGQQREDAEEDTRNLQPKHSGEPHERAPHRLAKAPALTPQTLLDPASLRHRPGRCRDCPPGR